MSYQPISASDRAVVQAFTLTSGSRACDLSWSNLCSWGFLFHPEYRVGEDFLFLRFRTEQGLAYYVPIPREAEADVCPALEVIKEECRAEGARLTLLGVQDWQLPLLERWRPAGLTITEDRNRADYLYLRTSLSDLAGKALQPKRNHINKFLNRYAPSLREGDEAGGWAYEAIAHANIQDCLEMERTWCIANGCDQDAGLGQERQAVLFALHHFEELGLMGGLLRAEGRIVAFTFGMPINADTFGVHVEKADSAVDGSYPLINREFARRVPEQFVYLNREEDMGVEGLRRAKLSYQPALILSKYRVEVS
jgi:hypothetical protein